jgi:NADPH-dependent 2,4-dienoyl-CoA reductase/sulfur reductase-like enzyme/rhodanese-related sulfurtransferase
MTMDRRQKIVVIGASAAGLRAAARARRLMPEAAVIVLDERTFISYGACGLPYYLSGDIEDLDKLRQTTYGMVRDPEFFARVKGLDVKTRIRVVRFDPVAKQIFAVNLDTEERPVFSYDKLVIATGARPRPLVGLQPGPACSFFNTPEEATALRKGLETGQIGSVIIVGGGFIGVELATAFGELWGCEVTVLEAMDRILPQLMDSDMAAIVAGHMQRQGVAVHTGKAVTRVATEEGKAVVEAGGETFTADRVVVAVGVVPRVTWTLESGLETGPCGGVAVGERLETNLPDVFAAGDCVEVKHRVSGCCALVPLGSLANRQGRVVGDNLAGIRSRFGPVTGSSCVKVFDWNVAATGLTVGTAKQAGLRPRSTWGTFTDRAHYYPEHEQIFLKLVYEEGTRRLLGLQACGPGGVVGRVDMFASLLHRDGILDDLIDLEHCYSPPFNAALDPLYVLGCAALNQEESGIAGIGPTSLLNNYYRVDLRTAEEITEEYPSPPGAVNIPLQELRQRVDELPRDRPLLLVCAMGTRSSEATRWLSAQGFTDLVYLAGGVNMLSQK